MLPSNEIVPEDKIVWVNGHPCPPAPPVRPVAALKSVLKLVRDKENTMHVFDAVGALSGDNALNQFRNFTSTPYGRRVVETPVRIETVLSDRAFLRSLPEGSLGRAYLAFMEGENLTADGLIDAAEDAGINFRGETQFPGYSRAFLHQSVNHDLWHVMAGYGRDALGELCVLAFSVGQTGNPGFRLIIAIGAMAQKLEAPGVPILKAIEEGFRMGRGVNYLLQHDVEVLLRRPLDEVRAELGFIEPVVYNSIPDAVKRALLQPKTKAAAADALASAA
jgi:ubiquinone biosynthesis protein COQ4